MELYSLGDCKNLNAACHTKLCKLAGLKVGEKRINSQKMRKADGSLLPPCTMVWQKKEARSRYIGKLWFRSDLSKPASDLNPVDNGWRLEAGRFVPVWYDGSSFPDLSYTHEEEGDEGQRSDKDNENSDSEELYGSDSEPYEG